MITFVEETHTYLYNGVVIPSVSEFLAWLFPNKYKGIDEEVLSKKATFGTNVHKAIEEYENGYVRKPFEVSKYNYMEEACLNQYLRLKNKYKIEVEEQEQIVTNGFIAGRLDMVGTVEDLKSLIDLKTTAKLDKDYLSWQLSMYEFLKGTLFEKLYCIWLPKKNLGQLVEIERIDRKTLIEKLEEFLKSREEGNLFNE